MAFQMDSGPRGLPLQCRCNAGFSRKTGELGGTLSPLEYIDYMKAIDMEQKQTDIDQQAPLNLEKQAEVFPICWRPRPNSCTTRTLTMHNSSVQV